MSLLRGAVHCSVERLPAFTLIGLSGPATAAGRVARVLLYAGFIMIPIGAILYLLAKARR